MNTRDAATTAEASRQDSKEDEGAEQTDQKNASERKKKQEKFKEFLKISEESRTFQV